MDNINVNQQQKKPRKDVSGSNNPMWGRTHSQLSKEKMSQAASLRNQQYRDALRNQHHVTMDELLGNPKMQEYITHLVKTQIDEMIWKKKNEIDL
ncbi:MAG: hypothetical protein IKN15_05870 [Bacteroidaceae bacterium]|nr:hypothetical protein [Bacteroidaceae bacterium]